MNKQYFVNVVNLETGKVFSLPTLYIDRVEACICGQNYVRDRQAEDPRSELFFRVLVAKDGQVLAPYSLWEDEEEDENDCDCPGGQEDCFGCPNFFECWEEDEDEDDEEPEHGESIFGGMLVTELIDLSKSEAPEAPEEPSSESLAEILSVFNAMRPNY